MSGLPLNEKPKDMTEGLGNFVAMIHHSLKNGNVEGALRLLEDLYEDIGGAYVCVERELEYPCPVPEYDPDVDGDYSSWLVANNID